MKKLFRTFLLTVMCLFLTDNLTDLNVNAAESASIAGIDVSVSSDKEEYSADEEVKISYSIRNENENDVDGISWKIKIPEGLKLKEGSTSGDDLLISSGEEINGDVVIVKNTTSTTTTAKLTTTTTTKKNISSESSVKTGDDTNMLFLVSVIAAAAILAFISRKRNKKTLGFFSILFCTALIAPSVPFNISAAENEPVTITTEKIIKLDNNEYKIELTVNADEFSSEGIEPTSLYAWAEYSKKNDTINIKWLAQEDASSYKVYDKIGSKKLLTEVTDKAEYAYSVKDSDSEKFVFCVEETNADGQNIKSNNVTVKRNNPGSYVLIDIDSDRDGLEDLKEINRSTDRLDPDTDKDGLLDGYEHSTTKTDPLKYDSKNNGNSDGNDDPDGDGLTNAQECVNSTDPFKGDTDGDGFPDGYEVANSMDPLTVNEFSINEAVAAEIDDFTEYDLEVLNLTEANPMDIFYNEEDVVERINGVYTDRKIRCAQDAFYAICNVRSLLGLQDPVKELKYSKFSSSRDTNTYYFGVKYDGVEIYGKYIILTCNQEGKATSLTSYYEKSEAYKDVNTVPDISFDELAEIINRDSEKKTEILSADLYIKADDIALLEYCVKAKENETIWVDAHTGSVISRNKNTSVSTVVQRAGEGEDHGYYFYPVIEENKRYYMSDDENIALYDFQDNIQFNNYYPDIMKKNDSDYAPYSYEAGEAPLPVAASTYSNVISAYNWYAEHDYTGLNGDGSCVPVFINDNISLNLQPSTEYLNEIKALPESEKDIIMSNAAFAHNDSEILGGYDLITFTPPYFDDRRTVGSSLALVGHEYGHAVFKYCCGIDDYNHDNATQVVKTLNEAYADIFGFCVKGDWEEFKKPLRNVIDPHKTGNPAVYNDSYFDSNYADEHQNATVISHAAYLMNHEYGISMEDIWTLFHQSLNYITKDTTLKDIRFNVLSAATDKGYSQDKKDKICNAFDDVGLRGPTGSVNITVINRNIPMTNKSVYLQKKDNNTPYIQTTNGQGVANFTGVNIGTYDAKVFLSTGQSIVVQITLKPNQVINKTIVFGTGSTDFEWKYYDHENYEDRFAETLDRHIEVDDENSEIKMIGYTVDPIKDFMVTKETGNIASIIHSPQKNISFSIKRDYNNWHTMEGGGFLFDVSITDEDEESGSKGKITAHCVLVTQLGLRLYTLRNVDIEEFSDGKLGNVIRVGEQMGESYYDIGNVYDEHNFTIRIDKSGQERITIWDGANVVVDNLAISRLPGDCFGPITSHTSHYCEQVSWFTFSDIKINLVTVH